MGERYEYEPEQIQSRGETRIICRELDDNDLTTIADRIGRTFTDQREVEASFKQYRKWAEPRIRRALDPDYESDADDEAELSVDEAVALQVDLDLRRVEKTASVAKLKAYRNRLKLAHAMRREYRAVEVDAVADPERLTIIYVVAATGEVVDQRGMTEAERQQALFTDDDMPTSNGAGAPATVQ